MTRVCLMCHINPAPDLTYGESDRRTYVCDDCVASGHRRAAAMQPEIDQLRQRREASEDRSQQEQAEGQIRREHEQAEMIAAIRRQWPDRF